MNCQPNILEQTRNLLFAVLKNITATKDRVKEKRKALVEAERLVFECRQALKKELFLLKKSEKHMLELEDELRVMDVVES
ncbi:hypothetical protein CJU90_4465 [Yarrowia sp. C11]|nr:hypothetical protein CJU90_4465 [Yarrowia sp. C11]